MKLKLLLVGDTYVGKTSIMNKYSSGKFTQTEVNTIGFEMIVRQQTVENSLVQLQIWSTGGQERCRSIVLAFGLRGSHGVMLVYDITDVRSFASIRKWVEDVEVHADDGGVPMILIGNKCDEADKRKISTSEGAALAESLNIPFMEVSAKTGSVTEAFIVLAREAKDNMPVVPQCFAMELDTIAYSAMPISSKNEHNMPPPLLCMCCLLCQCC